MHEYKATMLRIVDGDTVDVDIDLGFGVWLRKQRIRLYGMDTPESRTRDLEEKHYGNLSKNFIKDRLPVGTVFKIRTEKDSKGKFGRILGILLDSNDVSINDTMIAQGYAVPYHGQSKEDIEAEHLNNRIRLTEAGLGFGVASEEPYDDKYIDRG